MIKDNTQITIQYEHKKEMYTKSINPNQMLKLLPFLRDATEGIGTLTYFDPVTKEFGALRASNSGPTIRYYPKILGRFHLFILY